MFYWALQHLVWEVFGSGTSMSDVAAWTGASLDFVLGLGLFFLVAQALWRSRPYR